MSPIFLPELPEDPHTPPFIPPDNGETFIIALVMVILVVIMLYLSGLN